MTADDWVASTGAVCCEEGCVAAAVATRPTRTEYELKDASGRVLRTYAAGEADESVCAEHAEEN